MTGKLRPGSPLVYATVSVGGFIGAAVGVAAGWASALALENPEAGMANLALLLIPFGLALVAQPVGVFIALRLLRHPDARPVAALTGAFALVLAVVGSSAGLWMLYLSSTLILAAPALALHVRLRTRTPPPCP